MYVKSERDLKPGMGEEPIPQSHYQKYLSEN